MMLKTAGSDQMEARLWFFRMTRQTIAYLYSSSHWLNDCADKPQSTKHL